MKTITGTKLLLAAVLLAVVLTGAAAVYIGLTMLNDDIQAFRGTFIYGYLY
jgi:hypothetical protein